LDITYTAGEDGRRRVLGVGGLGTEGAASYGMGKRRRRRSGLNGCETVDQLPSSTARGGRGGSVRRPARNHEAAPPAAEMGGGRDGSDQDGDDPYGGQPERRRRQRRRRQQRWAGAGAETGAATRSGGDGGGDDGCD
jgi:hypothetical protein